MKKLIIIGSIILLAGVTSVQAQSGGNLGGNTGQQGSSPQNYGRKANTSQTTGRGVPYNKDAEQQGGRSGSTATSRAARQSPGSSGLSSAGTATQKNTSGGASTRQSGTKQGGTLPKNTNAKSGSGSSSNQ